MKHIFTIINTFFIFLTLSIICIDTIFANIKVDQTGTVKGKITTNDNQAAAGVTILIKAIGNGTTTDENGAFVFRKLKAGSYTLQISLTGFETIEQIVNVEENKVTHLSLQLKISSKQLQEIIVKGNSNKKYTVTNNVAASRIDLKIMEIPGSIQALSNIVLRDQQVNNVQEAIKNIPGINTFSAYDDYSLRGFRSYSGGYDGNISVNGQPGSLGTFDIANATFNIDRIEAIKGPASVLFSRATPGGVINYVTKQPLENTRIEADFTFGSFEQYRAMVDVTGSVTKNKKLLGRFILGYEDTKNFRNYEHNQTLFIAPSFLYRFSRKTSWKVEANIYHLDAVTSFERGIFAAKNPDGTWKFNAVPTSWSRHTAKGENYMRNFSIQSQLKHDFNPNFSIQLLNYYSNVYNRSPVAIGGGYPTVLASDTVIQGMSSGPGLQTPGKVPSLTNNLFLNFNFNTGFIKHRSVAGIDYMTYGRYYEFYGYGLPDAPIANPDLFNYINHDISNLQGAYIGYDQNKIFGAYLQHQLIFSPKLKALIGGRFDQSKYIGTYYGYPDKDSLTGSDTSDAKAFVPRAGLVYQPTEEFSVYFNYSESFQPQYANSRSAGGPFKPERGKQYELGVKRNFFNNLVTTTLSLYHITKQNVLTPDITDTLGIKQTQQGEVQSKGIEFVAQGELAKDLNGILGYSYNEAKVTRSKNGDEGQWNPMAPNTTWNVWLKYTSHKGILKNFGLAAGSNYVGKRITYDGPAFVLPAYTVLDASLSYKYKKAGIAINVYNLANKLYFPGAYGSSIIWPGAPRSFRLNLNYIF